MGEPQLQPDEAASPDAFASATVLLVEDQASVRQFVRKVLEYGGYDVIEANGGFEALSILSRNSAAIDLVLTDVVMPGMSGRLMADTLANKYQGLKVLFMSGNAELVRVFNAGSMDGAMLCKPFTSFMLLERVRQVLDGDKTK